MKCTPVIAGEFIKKVIPFIDNAKCTIDICVFDWRWYPQDPASPCQLFNQAVVRARKRGVQVRAIINNQGLVNIFNELKIQSKKFVSGHLLHAKFMLIDQKIVITGSHNYTQSAFSSNYELSIILEDIENPDEFSNFFDKLW
jgi:phosphatidylserine/phosphatidylglycerophosphate/cardiolipin synthase-like enzyme